MKYLLSTIPVLVFALAHWQAGSVRPLPPERQFGVYSETVDGCIFCGTPDACCCWGTYSSSGSLITLSTDRFQAPEGMESMRAGIDVPAEGWAGWFVQWGAEWDEEVTVDMRPYVHGYLRFWMKTSLDLRVGIRSQNIFPGEELSQFWVSEYTVLDGQWHDVSIPITSFLNEEPNLDLACMKILFNVACLDDTDGPASFSLDHVRWAAPDEPVLIVSEARPDRSLNTGSVPDTIVGWGFEDGIAASLVRKGAVIQGTSTMRISSEVLTTVFAVADAEEGDWDVVAVNPGGQSDTLEGGFTIRFLKPPSTGEVAIIGRQLMAHGELYAIKGVGYAPTPIGEEAGWPFPDHGSPDTIIYSRDFALLQQMGCNTIRTWGKVSQALLDYADIFGLKVICGYWVNTDLDLESAAVRDYLIYDFRSYVRTFMDWPAVLMWSVGNEQNYQNGDNPSWYRLVNEMARAAYEEEGQVYHPVTTPNGEILNIGDSSMDADDISMNYLDVWGANVYRGISFGSLFDDFARKSAKPFWISEYGIDAWDHTKQREYRETQAAWVIALWGELEQNTERCSGGTIMAYCDEWWKNGDAHSHDPGGYQTPFHPDGWSDEEYYGIMSVEGAANGPDTMHPREIYHRLQEAWRPDVVMGDVDQDGRTTVLDVVAVINHILNLSLLRGERLLAADCDGDGQINVLDALGIVNIILGTGTCAAG